MNCLNAPIAKNAGVNHNQARSGSEWPSGRDMAIA